MIIEYTVLDVVKILIKKWYIILLIALIMGGISLPIVNSYYYQSLENYENNTSYEFLLEQTKQKLYAQANEKEEMVEISDIDLESLGMQQANYYYKTSINSPNNSEEGNYDFLLMDNFKQIFRSDDFLIPVYNSIANVYTGGEYEIFKNSVSTRYHIGSNLFIVTIDNINQESVNILKNNALEKELNTAGSLLEKNLSFSLEKLNYGIKAEKANEDFFLASLVSDLANEALIESIDAIELANEKLAYNKVILKEPQKKGSLISTIGSASVAGIIIGCFIVLVVDYFKFSWKEWLASELLL